ncbi:sensor histidine kinase [Actinacidiphila oryziradicis]|uniref:histidine kinase n=1 Tax=Actinacidiphila oryziradicis TaxID=2571141 RepID=A0A4U0RS08_9ACTN|nr:histidine kinase [Actinacidiphila oryziradicis]TJZ98851.1 sensor histidine kinase [Actinacidiphila oryziradicis]
MNVSIADRLVSTDRQDGASTGHLPRLAGRSRAFDAALALILTLISVRYVTIMNVAGTADWIGSVLLVPLAPALLAVRRLFPLAVLWTVMAVTPLIRHDSPDIAFCAGVVCIVAAYSAAAYGVHRVPTLVSLPVAAAVLAVLFTNAKLPHFPNGAVAILVLIPVFAAAYEIRMWRHRVDEGRARLSILEREQVEALNRAVEHERARIARELHDVVTHNVGVMVIQAGAARKIMDAAPDQAREALLAVETSGRAAMTELRHVMGLLTMDSDGPDAAATADLTPQPGLNRLEALVAGVRQAGMPVELTVAGQQRPVPPGVELAAYRVVQEALTNTVKHASGATAEVTVEFAVDQLRVEVTDTGGRPSASASSGNGRGLIGLRERLVVYGGTLHTGPRPRGGYRVEALIPLEAP